MSENKKPREWNVVIGEGDIIYEGWLISEPFEVDPKMEVAVVREMIDGLIETIDGPDENDAIILKLEAVVENLNLAILNAQDIIKKRDAEITRLNVRIVEVEENLEFWKKQAWRHVTKAK